MTTATQTFINLTGPASQYVGQSFTIEVVGNILLSKVNPGRYTVTVSEAYGTTVANFYKGSRWVACHSAGNLLGTERIATYCQNHIRILSQVN